MILQTDFTVTPSPPGGASVIYAGAYPTQSAAEQALAKLKRKFPGAKVVGRALCHGDRPGKVLTKTNYGSAHR